ncbi:hypothetical protein B0H11DRAFT_956506 [Mycena galericulata]|nr:hypothetical protein B0H11DRAFT_956506 [Mycena galericulata]
MSTTTTTISYIKYAAGVNPKEGQIYQRVEEIDPDKSTLIRDPQPQVTNQVSNAVLLRTVVDYTSRLLVLEFTAALRFANESVGIHQIQHPNDPLDIDILDLGPQVFTPEDYRLSIRFAYLVSRRPYTESYSLLLSSLQLDEITVNGVRETVPHIPRLVWEKILGDNIWVSSYIDSAGDVSNFCSNLIHGNMISPIWTLSDLDVALHTSTFSPLTQAGLRLYMIEHSSTKKFLSRE